METPICLYNISISPRSQLGDAELLLKTTLQMLQDKHASPSQGNFGWEI